MINPFPNLPNSTDLGNGLRLVETRDRGHCYRVLEPDGRSSVIITVNCPPATPMANPDESFRVRETRGGQEIVSADGVVIATTTDPQMAKHIRSLLVVWENLKRKKAAGALPGNG